MPSTIANEFPYLAAYSGQSKTGHKHYYWCSASSQSLDGNVMKKLLADRSVPLEQDD
jgi:hypothetical protein